MTRAIQPLSLVPALVLLACSIGRAEPATTSQPASAPATSQPIFKSGPLRGTPKRPLLSDDGYKKLAAELRAAYSKPREQWPAANVDAGVKNFRELGPLPPVTFPPDNPYSKEKAELGKQLFFDPRLSASGSVACASCHDPDLAWSDGRTVAFGHERQAGKRNSPTIMNAAFQSHQFWDGRVLSLEEQAMMPIIDDREMHATFDVVIERLNAQPAYREQFHKVFTAAADEDEVSMGHVAQAIATFERTIVGGRSKFDSFVNGDNPNALSDDAVRGLHLFRTAARCINCHNGPNFTDDQFHNIGLTYYGGVNQDLGRYAATKKPEDVGKFKTPSLRNVARTAPYMHNGLFELPGVINVYNVGGPDLARIRRPDQMNDPLYPVRDPLMKPLALNDHDKQDLIAFLESLSEPKQRVRPPALPGLGEPKPATTRAKSNP